MVKDKSTYHILIVEDNPGDFALVEDYLLEQIHEPVIVRAESFKTGAQTLKSTGIPFDVILLDLTLPDKSGKVLVDDFLKIAGDCPVIVLTGYTDIDFSIHSISLGVADYLLKDDLNGISLYKSIIYCLERRKKIKEITESEKRYSDLFHLSPQPMYVYDIENLQFLDINHAAIIHYGYKADEFLNITLKDIRFDEDLEQLNEIVDYLKKNTDRTYKGSFRHKKKNGEIILVDVQTNAIFYKNKKAQISIVTDVTERSNYIKTIEDQNKKLQEIAWMQSHLVRAPLARIMGITDLIQNHTIENETELNDLLQHLLNSANELDTIIKDVSDKTFETKTKD